MRVPAARSAGHDDAGGPARVARLDEPTLLLAMKPPHLVRVLDHPERETANSSRPTSWSAETRHDSRSLSSIDARHDVLRRGARRGSGEVQDLVDLGRGLEEEGDLSLEQARVVGTRPITATVSLTAAKVGSLYFEIRAWMVFRRRAGCGVLRPALASRLRPGELRLEGREGRLVPGRVAGRTSGRMPWMPRSSRALAAHFLLESREELADCDASDGDDAGRSG